MTLLFAPNTAELIGYDVPTSDRTNTTYPVILDTPNLRRACYQNTVQGVMLAGRNPAASTSALGDIWGYPSTSGGSTQPVRALPTAGYTIAVVSDSANDVMTTGTGAWQVAVSYLDTNYLPHTAVYALNGATAVTVAASIDGGAGGTVSNALRQNGCAVVAVGTGGANAGNIYVCDSTNTYTAGVPQTTTKVFDCILAGDNADCSSQYTIPAGYCGLLLQIVPALNDYSTVVKYAKTRVNVTTGSDGIFLQFDLGGCSSNNNPIPWEPKVKPLLQPKSDIRIQAIVSAATEMVCNNQLIIWPASS